MLLVDVHAHLDFEDFDSDRAEVLRACADAGVKLIIANGVSPAANRKVQQLAEEFPLIKPAFGYYPVHVAEDGLQAVDEELSWIRQNKPVALGEVGLDYKVGDDNPHGDVHKEVQVAAFRKIIQLANELDVPVIVHSRKAENDVLDVLEEEKAKKVVLHCFSGRKHLIERARDLGYSFSIPAIVKYLQHFQWLVENVPLAQLLTETDAPYLGLVRGERNDSRSVKVVIEKIAEIKKLDSVEVANHVFLNYQRLFT